MTLIAGKLETAGYVSHFIGKWHVGMASKSTQTPQVRARSGAWALLLCILPSPI